MSFVVFADGTANLPASCQEGVTMLPCSYFVEGVEQEYLGDVDNFDSHAYYQQLASGCKITTSLLNTGLFLSHFRPVLVLRAAELSRQGLSAREAGQILAEEVPHICQYFTVNDLNFLKRSGRVSGATAAIGTVLNIKPILYGSADGHIVACGKVRGRKKAIDTLVETYAKKQVDAANHLVAISHGDCLADAQLLAEKGRAVAAPKDILIVPHEPFSGAHVGPGMLALFFYGSER